jgi:hypothetical protein
LLPDIFLLLSDFLELVPLSSNLLRRTPAQKDFRFTQAKRTGAAIGAKKLNPFFFGFPFFNNNLKRYWQTV